jgi:hypothetical protein
VNEILSAIERQFVTGLRRRQLRRRRRRTAVIAGALGVVALVAAGVGTAAITETPIDRLLHGDTPYSQAQDSARVDLNLTDARGVRWTAATCRAANGTLSSTAAAEGLPELPSVGGANGFVIADGLLNGPLAGIGLTIVRADGEDHYLVSGTADAAARTVAILIGGGRFDARLTGARCRWMRGDASRWVRWIRRSERRLERSERHQRLSGAAVWLVHPFDHGGPDPARVDDSAVGCDDHVGRRVVRRQRPNIP